VSTWRRSDRAVGRRRQWCLASAVLLGLSVASVSAQEPTPSSSPIRQFVKDVTCDPITYAPGAIGYVATRLDWASSQPLFRHGFVEGNARFTVSGYAHDVPIDYDAGRRRILIDALKNLGPSLANNFASRVVEHTLIQRYPTHKRLVQTLGWVERISFAAVMSYHLSASHFRQWRANERLVRQLGY
jgi:hypothetical protein